MTGVRPTAAGSDGFCTPVWLERGAKYRQSDAGRVQRIMAAGHGGQTLLSSATAEAVSMICLTEPGYQSLGKIRLRGLAQPEVVHQLVDPDLSANFPPLRAVSVANGLCGDAIEPVGARFASGS